MFRVGGWLLCRADGGHGGPDWRGQAQIKGEGAFWMMGGISGGRDGRVVQGHAGGLGFRGRTGYPPEEKTGGTGRGRGYWR